MHKHLHNDDQIKKVTLALVAAGAVFLPVAGFLGADLGVLPCIQKERRPKDAVNVRF